MLLQSGFSSTRDGEGCSAPGQAQPRVAAALLSYRYLYDELLVAFFQLKFVKQ